MTKEQSIGVLCTSVQESGADMEIATFAHEPGSAGARISLAYTAPRGTFQRGQHLELTLAPVGTAVGPQQAQNEAQQPQAETQVPPQEEGTEPT